jgi:hypothetical protein
LEDEIRRKERGVQVQRLAGVRKRSGLRECGRFGSLEVLKVCRSEVHQHLTAERNVSLPLQDVLAYSARKARTRDFLRGILG